VFGSLAEPVLLGFSSGLMCLAACGPVLLPWLASEGAGARSTGALLGQFLAGRLAGYLVFALAAWALGLALPLPAGPNALLFGAVHLVLGFALAAYAFPATRPRPEACPGGVSAARGRALAGRFHALGPAALGLLTGLNLCPPFLVAGVRAAQRHSLAGALEFFVLFFAGTLVWFLPFLAVGVARRFTAIRTVARFTTALVAAYYGYLGTITLGGALLHAWHHHS
jgi:sulfite exporter TauE/SafE